MKSETGVKHLRLKALMQIFSAISEKSVFLPQIHSVSVLEFMARLQIISGTLSVKFIVLSVIALFRFTF